LIQNKVHENEALNTSENKGYKFEKHVVSLFDDTYFTLLEWRSVKSHDGVFPLSCQFPDLEFYFQSKTESLHFAIECKWRQHFINDKIFWTNEGQYQNYLQFEEISKIPVFVILGVGGMPEKPGEIYSIPLREIETITLHGINLKPYQCNPENRPYLNCKKTSLRW
jgi:hypothetical protein